MIPTLYRPDDAVRIPAPVFDPDAVADPASVDDLVGAVPTWRLDDDPTFWEMVRDGLAPVDVAAAALEVVPWLLERLVDDPVVVEVSDPSQVDEDAHDCPLCGMRCADEDELRVHLDDCEHEHEVVDGPVTAPLQLVPPLDDEVEFDPDDGSTYPCANGGDCGCVGTGLLTCPGRDEDARDRAALRRQVEPDIECPDCGASGHDPCRPKHRPTGAPLPRWHARRRRLADTGSTSVLWLVILLVAVVVSGVVGLLVTSLSGLEDELRRPCPVPTAASCPAGPGGAR